jgi:hypothetical protein
MARQLNHMEELSHGAPEKKKKKEGLLSVVNG